MFFVTIVHTMMWIYIMVWLTVPLITLLIRLIRSMGLFISLWGVVDKVNHIMMWLTFPSFMMWIYILIGNRWNLLWLSTSKEITLIGMMVLTFEHEKWWKRRLLFRICLPQHQSITAHMTVYLAYICHRWGFWEKKNSVGNGFGEKIINIMHFL